MLNNSKKQQLRMFKMLIFIFTIIAIFILYINNGLVSKDKTNKVLTSNEELKIYFIDVGQGDATLLIQNDKAMLVDCGLYSESDAVVSLLNELNINKIDVLVGTHTHEDHMGGIAKIINNFYIRKLYTSNETGFAQIENFVKPWYYSFLFQKEIKRIKNNKLVAGDSFEFADTEVEVLGPQGTEYEAKNNFSLVLKVKYKNTSILLTGDCQTQEELEILKSGCDLKANIIKVPHHGSYTSSEPKFVEAVSPQYAVFSLAQNNEYFHPNKTILKRYKNVGAKIYRTDEDGTVEMSTDGQNITVQ